MSRRVGHNGRFATRHILHEDEIRSAFTAIGKEATVGILVNARHRYIGFGRQRDDAAEINAIGHQQFVHGGAIVFRAELIVDMRRGSHGLHTERPMVEPGIHQQRIFMPPHSPYKKSKSLISEGA